MKIKKSRRSRKFFWRRLGVATLILATLGFCLHQVQKQVEETSVSVTVAEIASPLAMKGGDPYIRALMRTISASESNVDKPYHVLYGGRYVTDLSNHPDQCVRIVSGPNRGNCSTAAGRYQMLSSTWKEMAKRYHPALAPLFFWQSYSFAPEYQDAVVYAWLKDGKYWKTDISEQLQQGKLDQVLRLLSGTWTSLGYGIETNSISASLPQLYQEFLAQELRELSEQGSFRSRGAFGAGELSEQGSRGAGEQ